MGKYKWRQRRRRRVHHRIYYINFEWILHVVRCCECMLSKKLWWQALKPFKRNENLLSLLMAFLIVCSVCRNQNKIENNVRENLYQRREQAREPRCSFIFHFKLAIRSRFYSLLLKFNVENIRLDWWSLVRRTIDLAMPIKSKWRNLELSLFVVRYLRSQ